MGSYNTAVITTVGQALLTSVLGAQGTMTFTKLQTSSYAYASGTDLSALTSLNNVEQEVNVGAASIIDSTHIAADATISNTGVTTEYNANTLGIFATDGNSEVLFAVSTAVTPDVIPVDSGGTPSTYKYKFTLAVSSTSDITISALGDGSIVHAVYEESPALAAHAVGTYVYFNNHVYKVTSAIAIGDAVAVGTNVALDPSLSGDDLITIEGVPGNSIIAASDVSYNNASSGLSATKVQGAIDEVNSKITSNTLGSIVDISEYTSSSPYTFPSDGYVWVGFDATEGEYEVSGRVLSSSGIRSLPIYAKSTTSGGHYASEYGASVFVKKGMKGFTLFNTSPSHGGLYFYPLS